MLERGGDAARREMIVRDRTRLTDGTATPHPGRKAGVRFFAESRRGLGPGAAWGGSTPHVVGQDGAVMRSNQHVEVLHVPEAEGVHHGPVFGIRMVPVAPGMVVEKPAA